MEYIKRIFSPSGIIAILKEQGLSLKERYGQNLLINRNIAAHVIKSANLKRSDSVLEIGTGLGALTFLIADCTDRVIAYEVDKGLALLLQQKAKQLGYRNICVVNKDFLKLREDELPDNIHPNKVVSNFPYNIGIKAIMKIIEEFPQIERITGTVQEEIAQRIMANPGTKNYSYISVYIQSMARVEYIMKHLAPSNFFPVPEVFSTVISVEPLKKHLSMNNQLFKRIVKQGFSNRRKSLINNLLPLGIEKDRLKAIVGELFNNDRVRAEDLSVMDFNKLCKYLSMLF